MRTTILLFALANFAFAVNNNIGYSYSLWIGDNVDEKYFIHLNSDDGIKFIDAMNQAAAEDPNFIFEFTNSQYGKFITKIANNSQDSTK